MWFLSPWNAAEIRQDSGVCVIPAASLRKCCLSLPSKTIFACISVNSRLEKPWLTLWLYPVLWRLVGLLAYLHPYQHSTMLPHQWATTGCRHCVAWTPAIFIDSVVARSTVVAQDHRRCERLEHATTGDHVIAVTADFQACIEDGTVLQIVRQHTLAATAALTLA